MIAKRNRGLNSAFTVRKISHGEGVERVFQSHSPAIADLTVKRRGDVRRAKLYYLRGLEGKAARIKEKLAIKSSLSGSVIWNYRAIRVAFLLRNRLSTGSAELGGWDAR